MTAQGHKFGEPITGPEEASSIRQSGSPEPSAAIKPRILRSDFDRLRIEYVGGHRPYLWIADADGKFIDAIDVKALREFLKGQRPWA